MRWKFWESAELRHVDVLRAEPRGDLLPRLVQRISLARAECLGKPRRPYLTHSEPHTMAECPFDDKGRRKR